MIPDVKVVEATVHARIKKLEPYLDKLERIMFTVPKELQGSKEPSVVRYSKLLSLVKEAAEILAPVVVCSKGCSHCCYMAVGITLGEAKIISEAHGLTIHKPSGLVSRDNMVEKYSQVQCPFLKKGVCSIYEQRPLACRTHYNLSDYPEVCDIINHPGHDTPNLDFRNVWVVAAVIETQSENFSEYSFGDIREFFPYGLDEEQGL